ncbi:LPXTG cell wall anchor domain-containing protein [Brevibacillus nitrificans]|uniref:LPXTG cell wall anchor domain-containing protein n=1 Tax=Brevibacillus nitrificans TaxID=651560 RepID=A0A3M8DJM3_9BACL|nr:LPXTG cell wall anchor domain-containing protein [Brevibacillus nitrificans]RNB87585.1 LPXTG cell wall anchor domain-containing protein [Brevibacillus nitrificans]
MSPTGQTLPQTGEEANSGTFYAGIALILIGLSIVLFRRNKKA